jgi:hypothetical protein
LNKRVKNLVNFYDNGKLYNNKENDKYFNYINNKPAFKSFMSIEDLKNLILEKQIAKRKIQINSKKIYAENIKQPNLSKVFNSINSLAK